MKNYVLVSRVFCLTEVIHSLSHRAVNGKNWTVFDMIHYVIQGSDWRQFNSLCCNTLCHTGQ